MYIQDVKQYQCIRIIKAYKLAFHIDIIYKKSFTLDSINCKRETQLKRRDN